MFVLFEEGRAFKTGTIVSEHDSTLQVDSSHGKRLKLKRSNVLLQFNQPSPSELLESADAQSTALDKEFLWQVSPDEDFHFSALAREYFGEQASASEQTAVLLSLHQAPIYFHRRGGGHFRKAPQDILNAALAGAENRRRQEEQQEQYKQELLQRTLPESFAAHLKNLAFAPDRNRIEVKALEQASAELGMSVDQLLLEAGAFASTHDLHFQRFVFEQFNDSLSFADGLAWQMPEDLPHAEVRAFSIDDITTTEIDDAFSVTPASGGGWTIGIHIAAPGLAFARSSAMDEAARNRLSTVYMPGNKITMLPPGLIDDYTLVAGRHTQAVSLYLELSADLAITGQYSRIEKVLVVDNLRINELEQKFNEQSLLDGGDDYPWQQELSLLWRLATVLEAGRGKSNNNLNNHDYNFYVDWQQSDDDGPGIVNITRRQRGAPLDMLVAELMIYTNSSWGKLLAEKNISAIYRTQSGGKVKMSTVPGPHEGMGVDNYAWTSSPLRRYIDLVNQWQLIACLREQAPVFSRQSQDINALLREFELAYAAYAEFQRKMERFWCIRWLRQNNISECPAQVIRDDLVRLDGLPLVAKVNGAPVQLTGSQIQLAIQSSNLLDTSLSLRHLHVIAEASG